jgi:L-lactate dehydrogenase
VAISTLHSGVVNELLLCDLRADLAEGEAMDLAQGASFYPTATVRAAGLDEVAGADTIVVAAGRGGRPDESRLDLLRDNAQIVRTLGRRLAGYGGVVVIVTNPVDVLTRVMTDASGLPASRVIGTGTMLDTVRLRQVIARRLDVHAHSVHAHVVGEHGDSEVVLWSAARAGGVRLREWPAWDAGREVEIADEVRRAAYEIIKRKGATNHAIGLVTADLLQSVLRDERRVLTVSRVQDGVAGLRDVALSLPAVVGARGAADVLEPEMSGEERTRLEQSADVLRTAVASLREL